MTGKTHIALGTAAAVILAPMSGIDATIPLITGVALGSLIPDIEHPRAMINQRILPIKNKFFLMAFFISLGVFILAGGLGQPNQLMKVFSIFIILAGISSHRTFTHSILGLGIILYLSYLMYHYSGMEHVAIGMGIGALIHILADLFTSKGTALFYPFSTKRIKMPITVTTNGMIDHGLFTVSIMILLKHYLML